MFTMNLILQKKERSLTTQESEIYSRHKWTFINSFENRVPKFVQIASGKLV